MTTELTDQSLERVTLGEKEIFLVGTAHISQSSVELAEKAIRTLAPDAVAVELCTSRVQALKDPNRWKNTDIFQVIKSGRTYLLLAQLLLAAFQRKLGKELNIKPGAEMLRSVQVADELNLPVVLADREIKTTLKRTWAALSFGQKLRLMGTGPAKVFSGEKIDPAEIEKLKQSDVLDQAMKELAHAFPGVQRALIDERDRYLAAKIGTAPGKRIVAIIGAGHIPGIKRYLGTDIDVAALEVLPPKSHVFKILMWSIPTLVLGFIAWSFFSSGAEVAKNMAMSWILLTGTSAAIGALIMLAHPLTILVAFITSPFTALHAGWFAGLTEAMLRRPKVGSLETILDDISSIRGFYRNEVTRLFLVVAFPNLLSRLAAGALALQFMTSMISSLFSR